MKDPSAVRSVYLELVRGQGWRWMEKSQQHVGVGRKTIVGDMKDKDRTLGLFSLAAGGSRDCEGS